MTGSRITAAVLGLGLIAAVAGSALAQQPVIVVPERSAAPTVVAPSPGGTTVVAPPGSTVVVHPPAVTTATVVPVTPVCGGQYGAAGGTNFGSCPGYLPR